MGVSLCREIVYVQQLLLRLRAAVYMGFGLSMPYSARNTGIRLSAALAAVLRKDATTILQLGHQMSVIEKNQKTDLINRGCYVLINALVCFFLSWNHIILPIRTKTSIHVNNVWQRWNRGRHIINICVLVKRRTTECCIRKAKFTNKNRTNLYQIQ